MRLKVLQLEPWMRRIHSGHGTPRDLKEFTMPLIGRDGWYLEAGISWFELDGRAFTTPKLNETFAYKLKLLGLIPCDRGYRQRLLDLLTKLPIGYMHLTVRELLGSLGESSVKSRLPLYQHRKRVRAMAKKKNWPAPFTNKEG